MSKRMELTKGKFTIVDDDVYEWASQFKYYASKERRAFYACRTTGAWPFKRNIRLHREILNAPDGVQVDHINGDTLDNRRENLRLATHAQNQRNSRRYSNNTSGFKGVCWDKSTGKWVSRIKVEGRSIHLGLFADPKEAARAYDEASRKYHGEFAKTNF